MEKRRIRISKEEYFKHLDKIKEAEELFKKLFKMNIDMYESCLNDLVTSIIELLEHATDDKEIHGYSWLSYYVYELEFGEEWHEGAVTDDDDNDIPLKTYDDLWNLITKDAEIEK